MKKGYTTGVCAAAASYGAAMMLLSGDDINQVNCTTPSGVELKLSLEDIVIKDDYVYCAVRKDYSDDPDVTKGMLIYSKVELIDKGIVIDGGVGIGRVTSKGLDQPLGSAAINSMPRKLIEKYALLACNENGYKKGLKITIFAPEGENIAKGTLNAKLGIIGGISILGTSGIVEPMSVRAIIDTIKIEISVLSKKYDTIIASFGNYGNSFIADNMNLSLDRCVKVSNYIGSAIDFAVEKGIKELLIIAHIGKGVKLGAGIMNTHSSEADARLEILCASCVRAGANISILNKVLDAVTTDEAIDIIDKAGIKESVMSNLMDKIEYYTNKRVGNKDIKIGVVLFSNKYGILGQTTNADGIINNLKRG